MRFFEDRKIQEQIMLLLSVVIVTVGLIFAVSQSLLSKTYERFAIGYADDSMHYLSENIEREILRIRQLSLAVVTNQRIAELCILSAASDVTDKIPIHADLGVTISNLTSGFVYIDAISIFDLNDNKIAGTEDPGLMHHFEASILNEAKIKEGRIHWDVDCVPGSLLLARAIISASNISDGPIATLVVNINMERLITLLDLFNRASDTSLGIVSRKSVLYNNTKVDDMWLLTFDDEDDGGIQWVDKYNYIIAMSDSLVPGIRYITLTSYDSVLQSLREINIITIALILVCFIILASAVKKISEIILRPIKTLSSDMKLMETGCFDVSKYEKPKLCLRNEIHSFHNGFRRMIKTIDEFIQKNYRIELEKKNMELIAIYNRINPHFLYNTLNTIQWLTMAGKTKQSADVTFMLGQLLRNSIEFKGLFVTVKQELQFITQYLNIQNIRYQERLLVEQHVEEQTLDCLVPKFILQPIVENSIKYSLEESIGLCRIIISIKKQGQALVIEVSDNGPECVADYHNALLDGGKMGVGISSIIKLVDMTFHKDSKVSFAITHEKYFTVSIKIVYPENWEE